MNPLRLLCAIGIHRRIRDRSVPIRRGVFTLTAEYVCIRCAGRWEQSLITIAGEVGTMWERVT